MTKLKTKTEQRHNEYVSIRKMKLCKSETPLPSGASALIFLLTWTICWNVGCLPLERDSIYDDFHLSPKFEVLRFGKFNMMCHRFWFCFDAVQNCWFHIPFLFRQGSNVLV